MKLEKALDKCLHDIQKRNATVEDCLAQYPRQAEAIEPLLRLAASITEVPPVRPAPEFKRATRRRLLALSPPAELPRRRNWVGILASMMGGLGRRMAIASAGVILILIVLSGGAAVAAADSLPDSPLYPIKRVTEQAQLLLTPRDSARAKLHIAYAQRRLDEAVIMAQRGEEGRARELLEEYSGELQAAMAIVEELTTQTTKLSAELRGEVVEQSKTLESAGQTLSPEVKRLGLAAAREAQVGLSTLAVSSSAKPALSSPTPTGTQLIEESGVPTVTMSPTPLSVATRVIGTPPGLEGSPTAEVLSTPTTTAAGVTPTATQISPPPMPIRATPTMTAGTTPEPTLPTAPTPLPARFTPTPTATVPRATPTSSPALPTPTPTFTPRAYPGPTDTPLPTATPVSPTPTPMPPTSTPTPRAYPAPTGTPTPEPTGTPTPEPTNTPPSALRDTPTPTTTPVPPTSTPTPRAYPAPTDTPTPTNVPPSALGDTPTATPEPTDTPLPVPTDTPTTVPYPPPPGG